MAKKKYPYIYIGDNSKLSDDFIGKHCQILHVNFETDWVWIRFDTGLSVSVPKDLVRARRKNE